MFRGGHPIAFTRIAWTEQWAKKLSAIIGRPNDQTTWEFVMALLVLMLWGTEHREEGLALMGDNTAALAGAANLRGRGPLVFVARELDWRKVRLGWRYSVAHLPAEGNVLADALSRLVAPAGADVKAFPAELAGVPEEDPPTFDETWLLD